MAALLAGAARAQERGAGKSYAELFMGLHEPFAERRPAPKPGATPTDTVKALYANGVFFHLRNSFPKPFTDYLAPCFSKSLLSHFETSRAEIERWFELHQGQLLKLPMSEGAIFVGNYEGATRYRVGEAIVEKDMARVTVHLTYIEGGTQFEWYDTALLIRSDDMWLLDNILFDPARGGDSNLRKRTKIED
jgi:hypothetical protein